MSCIVEKLVVANFLVNGPPCQFSLQKLQSYSTYKRSTLGIQEQLKCTETVHRDQLGTQSVSPGYMSRIRIKKVVTYI